MIEDDSIYAVVKVDNYIFFALLRTKISLDWNLKLIEFL
jgi:hypothetical protein